MKKISIIVAVYNIEKYLTKCLDSIIAQKGDDIEILIVDDGSTDKSYIICKEYQKKDKRINLIHQKNKGLSSSRNVGIDNAQGEYLWFVDGDDYIEDNSIEIIRKYLDKYDIICFGYNYIQNKTLTKVFDNKTYDNINDKYILSHIVAWNKVLKKALFDNDRFPEGYKYNDVYIIPSLAYKTDKIIFIKEYLYNYIYRDNSLSHTRKFNLDEYIYCLNNVYNKVNKKYPDAAICYYINQLLIYKYAKEIITKEKYNYRKINKLLKDKFPKYYKNKYYNTSISKKIYIRLIYYDCIIIVKIINYLKLKIFNKYIRRGK